MTNTMYMLALVMASALAAGAQTSDVTYRDVAGGWQEMSSERANFALQAPARMALKTDSMSTGIGTVLYHTYFYQPAEKAADNHLYLFSHCDYPEYTVHADSSELLEDFFEATMEGATEAVQGELLYSDAIVLGDHPGRLWRINYLKGQATIKTRAYVVGNRYYALSVVALKDKNLNAAGDRFLESFRLLRD